MNIWIEAIVAVIVRFALRFSSVKIASKTERKLLKNLVQTAATTIMAILAIVVSVKTGRAAHWFTAENVLQQITVALWLALILVLVSREYLRWLAKRTKKADAEQKTEQKIEPMTPKALMLGIAKSLLGGVAIEIIYRGYFTDVFRAATGISILAVALSSLLFGLRLFPEKTSRKTVGINILLGAYFGAAMIVVNDCTLLSVMLAYGLFDAGLNVMAYKIKNSAAAKQRQTETTENDGD